MIKINILINKDWVEKTTRKKMSNNQKENKEDMVDCSKGDGKPKIRKGISIIEYDPENDINFHDIDMNEFRKWKDKHDAEYQEDLDIIKRLEAMCPRNEVVYSGLRNKNSIQRKNNPFYDVLYGFHEAANSNYLAMYRTKRTKRRVRYEALKAKAKEYLINPPIFESQEETNLLSVLDDIMQDGGEL